MRVPPVIATSGLVILVAGTFLPWLRSGAVDRNSYQAAAVADEFFDAPAVRLWLAVPLLTAVCVVLFVLRFARTAATATVFVATPVAVVALLALVRAGGSSGLIGLRSLGPAASLAGAGIALAGASGAFFVPTSRTGGQR